MTLMIPELTRRNAERVLREYCEARVPLRARSQVRLTVTVRGNALTVVEVRPPWKAEYEPEWTRHPIAQFRFDSNSRQWRIYWRDRNTRWRLFEGAAPSRDIETLVQVLDSDTTAIFWG